MTKLLVHHFPIHLDVYGRALTLLYGTRQQLVAYLAKHAPGTEEGFVESTLGRSVVHEEDDHEADFIAIKRPMASCQLAAVLSHECAHHAFHALRTAGLTITQKSEEAFCYYHGWVFWRCLKRIQRRSA